MRLSLTRPRALRGVLLALFAFVLSVACGCTTYPQRPEEPRFEDDFGDEMVHPPITEESVQEETMLHRRFRIEPNIGVVMPVGNFDWGPMAGVKGSVEAFKNVFWGISFDWAHQEVIDPISTLSQAELITADPDQRLRNIDRYNLLVLLEYSTVLKEDFLIEKAPLSLRLGMGLGSSIIGSTEDPLVRANNTKVLTYVGFLMRPTLDLAWQVDDRVSTFLGTGFDFVFPEEVDTRVGGFNRVLDDVQFSTFFVRAGLTIDF